jgi:hypothetical protein
MRNDVVLSSGKLDIDEFAPIARMGYYDYAVMRDTLEMKIPTLSAALMDGLEGKIRG